MISFFILLFVMIGIWALFFLVADTSEISKNWPKYRCNPVIMPLASLFGHDITENFNFCLNSLVSEGLGGAFAPIFKVMSTFLGTLMTLVTVANSIRLEMATFMGGVNTVFQNFMDRFVQLGNNVKLSALRMKLLMGRLFGTFYAIIYMGMSGITALTNFGDTFLFKFLDTFCFDPDTPVFIQDKGLIPVKDVQIGDVFSNGSKVTACFSFLADGQPMVELPGPVIVSTNHFIQLKDKWVKAEHHPDAKHVAPWKGGSERPLICFNTHNHRIPVGNYLFLDYDETSEGDNATMNWVEGRVNGKEKHRQRNYNYTTLFSPSTQIRLKTGRSKPASTISLGDELSFGKVISVIRKNTKEFCELPSGDIVTPGLLIWNAHQDEWFRAGDRYPIREEAVNQQYYSFIVSPTANIELASGLIVRDYFEVHSPETEQFYAKAIHEASSVLAE